jgi:hypothetical protein
MEFRFSLQSKPNNQGKMTWFWYHFIPVDFHTVRSAPFLMREVIQSYIIILYEDVSR